VPKKTHPRGYTATQMPMFDISPLVLNFSQSRDKLILVAIDGPGCAGKSTLALELVEELGGSVVQGDDFYRVMDPNVRASLDAEAGYEKYFDWERLRKEVLEPLSKGRAATYQIYDWKYNCLGGVKSIEPDGLVIVEGVYSFRPELRSFYQKSILVATSLSVRSERATERGQNSKEWINRWVAAENYYLEKHNPERKVDWIYDGETGRLV